MDDAFAVVAHPQVLVAFGALLLFGLIALLELSAVLQAWRWRRSDAGAVLARRDDIPAAALGPEAYDWLYE